MKLPRRLTAAIVMTTAIAMAILPTAAYASSYEAKWGWESNWNWLWVNWNTGTAYVTTLEAQVQNNNETEDAFTIEICNPANCPVYGPVEIGRGDAWFENDGIYEYVGVPGFYDTTTICEYAVGCTAETVYPWGKT